MSPPATLSNLIVMNKYMWVCSQLRHYNDAVSIVNWANAMMHVKGLLLESHPEVPIAVNTQPSSSHQHSLHRSAIINQRGAEPDRSITRSTTISFQPTLTMPLPSPPQDVLATHQPNHHLCQYTPIANLTSLHLIPPRALRGEKYPFHQP